jgi:hypothetical protein
VCCWFSPDFLLKIGHLDEAKLLSPFQKKMVKNRVHGTNHNFMPTKKNCVGDFSASIEQVIATGQIFFRTMLHVLN